MTEKKTVKKAPRSYSKDAIVKTARGTIERTVLKHILDPGKTYTREEAARIYRNFLAKKEGK